MNELSNNIAYNIMRRSNSHIVSKKKIAEFIGTITDTSTVNELSKAHGKVHTYAQGLDIPYNVSKQYKKECEIIEQLSEEFIDAQNNEKGKKRMIFVLKPLMKLTYY